MNKLFLCCFPQRKEIILNNKEEEVEIKNQNPNNDDEKVDLANSTKSRSKISKSDINSNINNNIKDNVNCPSQNNNNKASSRNDIRYPENSGKISNLNDNKESISEINKNIIMSNENINSNIQIENNSNNFLTNNKVNNPTSDIKKNNNNGNVNRKDDVSIVEITNSARVITDADIKNAPSLIVEEIAGNILKNKKLMINAAGLVGGMRKMRDGVAFFGKNLKQGDIIVNDFELNIDYSGNGLYTFIIYYKKDNNKYYIRAYRDKQSPASSMLLIKLEDDFYLTRKEILSISDYFFQLNPLQDKLEINKLPNKNNPNTEKFCFDNSQEIVTIGRDSKCNINFNGDKAFSKIQTTFTYDKDLKVWTIKDGSQDKPSTNGTWIFAAHSFEIFDKTIVRLGNSKIAINFQ